MREREDPGQQQTWPDVELHGGAAQQSVGKAVLCKEANEVARGEAAAQAFFCSENQARTSQVISRS